MQRARADADVVVDVVGLADVVGRLVLLTTKRCLSVVAMKANEASISIKWNYMQSVSTTIANQYDYNYALMRLVSCCPHSLR